MKTFDIYLRYDKIREEDMELFNMNISKKVRE